MSQSDFVVTVIFMQERICNMNYAMADLHNDFSKFDEMLGRIRFDRFKDHLYIVGDLFDRGNYDPDPFGVYYKVLSLEESITFIRGNHDTWLARYIHEYYGITEKKREGLRKYGYNSFELLRERLVEQDMVTLANRIMRCPVQVETEIEGKKYLFAHAMSSHPEEKRDEDYYLMGGEIGFPYLSKGIDGYICINGHTPTDMVRLWYGDDYQPKKLEIWRNPKGNVYMLDCGCGLYYDCRLGCLCIEMGEAFYVD